MFDLKMDAAENRTEARDLYDIAHLLRMYGRQLTSEQIVRVEIFSHDIDNLATRYASSFDLDDALRNRANVNNTVIALRETVEELCLHFQKD
jgi:predicted nucleotidyltransferase component of viral defense system